MVKSENYENAADGKKYLCYALYEHDLIVFLVYASGPETAKERTVARCVTNGWDKPDKVGARLLPTMRECNHVWTMHSSETYFSSEVEHG